MKLGVVTRRGKRQEDIRMFSQFFEVKVYEIPDNLPELIDEPEKVLKLPEDFDVDMIVSFAAHPDINLELIKQAAEKGISLVIVSGGARGGAYRQLKEEGERRGVRVVWEEICCTTPKVEDEKVGEFFEHFGSPELDVLVENGRIKDVKVRRSAFCGATYFVAEKIKGLSIEEAPAKAGYFTQIFPCLASRGHKGGIHKAARAHKRAVEKAVDRALKD
uniref:Thymidylate synthase n=1 Tax=Archaeoglobus fulgidus TaxID=2234 RepID=A0A7C3RAW3_ARCFL